MNDVLLHDPLARRWLRFSRPRRVIAVAALADVLPALDRIAAAVDTEGVWAAGFVSYEAAPAMDAALAVRPAADLPLLWFGLYDPPGEAAACTPRTPATFAPAAWDASLSCEAYDAAIEAIRRYIRAGDTYQVNYSFRLRTAFTGDPHALFAGLLQASEAPYAAFIDTDAFAIASASPELFFRLDGDALTARPMKGTAPRGVTSVADRALARELHASEKNRAENVMIVDMVRNDMGRVAAAGSVTVPELYALEKYPTLWQMTSSVASRTSAGIVDILKAMFPCASITGAPKRRTMQIIAELETSPRGIYTGCIGYVAPGRRAQFNVAIRTVAIDKRRGRAEYGVGGGIVWDSTASSEYDECRTKARTLTEARPVFSLLETLLWTPAEGYRLLDRHLARLADSAEYFDFPADLDAVRRRLEAEAAAFPREPRRVRLLVARDGAIVCEHAAPPAPPRGPARVRLAPKPIDAADPFLYHKTTHRRVYAEALAACPGCDDVLLWNARGEITESTIANVVVELDGRRVTPPVACGLLAGTYRGRLLDEGRVEERIVRIEDLRRCACVILVNSVRGEWEAKVEGISPCCA